MDLVDDIHRLRVSYRFENEIEKILKQIHQNTYVGDNMLVSICGLPYFLHG